MSKRKGPSPDSTRKKVYRTPALRVHGDIRDITRAKGGTKNDSGGPKTKTTGSG